MVRNSARLLAPIAIAAVAVGVYLIVHNNVVTTHTPRRSNTSRVLATHGRRRRHPASAAPTYYTVRPGDTLSSIAARTGVAIGRLTALNRSLSPPYSLQTGQRLRLRR